MNYTKTLLDYADELNVCDLKYLRSTAENLTAWVARGSYTHEEALEIVEDTKREIRSLAADKAEAADARWAATLRAGVEASLGCDRHVSCV